MRRAFTILETLAATALTALLLVAVLQVIGTLGRSRNALAHQAENNAWKSDLLDTLRYDLTNATAGSFRSDGMTLTSHGALDRNTLSHHLDAVTVTYAISAINGRRWLVRNQTNRDGPSGEPWTELVCPDVEKFTIARVGSVSRDATPNQSIPPVVSVLIDGPAGRIVAENLVLR